jgi:CheY-like chemotaxis protein
MAAIVRRAAAGRRRAAALVTNNTAQRSIARATAASVRLVQARLQAEPGTTAPYEVVLGKPMASATQQYAFEISPVTAPLGTVRCMTTREAGNRSSSALVLVVDDEPGIVEFLRFALEDNGYRVTAAHDGRQALETLERETPDFVLTDLMMPRVDGWELCRRLRSERETADTPIIGMSAVEPGDAQFNAFLRKPFELDDLLRILDDLVAAGTSGRQCGSRSSS